MIRFILFLAGVFSSSSFADRIQLSVHMEIESCFELLQETYAPSPFDYMVSDLEGLYLDLLEEAKELGETPAEKVERKMEIFIKKKAEFLNDLGGLISEIRQNFLKGTSSGVSLTQVGNMVMSLGVDPGFYGLMVSESHEVVIRPEVAKKEKALVGHRFWNSLSNLQRRSSDKKSFGFVSFEIKGEKELPRFKHRSIGFSQLTVEEYEAPQRRSGLISFDVDENQSVLTVIDRERETTFTVPLSSLQTNGYKDDYRAFHLKFSQEERGWVVAFESFINPDGAIGFIPSSKN